jgi:N-acetylglucosaminyl-diphospho-decaprenol L-rhamnosyltransferase
MHDLAVVIVTWNVEKFITDALKSLQDDLQAGVLDAQIIVVDNASHDGTVSLIRREFPDVLLIPSEDNLGFGRANNLGMQHLGFSKTPDGASLPRAVYLLNPDTITQKGATRHLYDTLMANEQVGLVGAKLAYEDGTFQHGAFAFPGLRQLWAEFFPTPGRFIEGRFNGRYPRAWYTSGQPFDVDFTLGATMMLRREVIMQTGMFDPNFFMYAEEVDWAWRIKKAGWRVLCVPQAHVTHLVGKSTGQARPRSIVNLWESRLRLFAKHYPTWKQTIAKHMIVAGMARKLAQTDDDAIADAYRKVQEMART